jgi:hypothetical protein
MRASWLGLLLPLFLLPLRGDAATLRCGNQIASEGASKSDVLMRCGEPSARDSHTEVDAVKTQRRDPRKGSSTSAEHVVYKTIEEWTYNFGPNRLMQVAVFDNGVLVDVRSGNYGR